MRVIAVIVLILFLLTGCSSTNTDNIINLDQNKIYDVNIEVGKDGLIEIDGQSHFGTDSFLWPLAFANNSFFFRIQPNLNEQLVYFYEAGLEDDTISCLGNIEKYAISVSPTEVKSLNNKYYTRIGIGESFGDVKSTLVALNPSSKNMFLVEYEHLQNQLVHIDCSDNAIFSLEQASSTQYIEKYKESDNSKERIITCNGIIAFDSTDTHLYLLVTRSDDWYLQVYDHNGILQEEFLANAVKTAIGDLYIGNIQILDSYLLVSTWSTINIFSFSEDGVIHIGKGSGSQFFAASSINSSENPVILYANDKYLFTFDSNKRIVKKIKCPTIDINSDDYVWTAFQDGNTVLYVVKRAQENAWQYYVSTINDLEKDEIDRFILTSKKLTVFMGDTYEDVYVFPN